MNQLQSFIFKIIINIFKIDKIEEFYLNSVIRYGILNYVAKYSLAKDNYLITSECFEYLNTKKFISDKGLRRGLKSKKNKFTYEHPIPSNIIADELFKNRNDINKMKKILVWSDIVTIITSREDEILSKKYISKMPNNWKFFNSNKFERYKLCGLENPPINKIKVFGAVKR